MKQPEAPRRPARSTFSPSVKPGGFAPGPYGALCFVVGWLLSVLILTTLMFPSACNPGNAAIYQRKAHPKEERAYRQPVLQYKPFEHEFSDEPWWEQFDTNRTIYILNTAGTCNTLSTVAVALTYAWANKTNVKFLFAEAEWEELFDFPRIRSSPLPDGSRDPRESDACKSVETHHTKDIESAKNFAYAKNPYGEGEIACIATCCWRQPPFGVQHMWFFRVLRPIQLLTDMMNEFKTAKRWYVGVMIGVHIRRSDNIQLLRLFLEAANDYEGDSYLFNTTDMDSILPLENYVHRMNELRDFYTVHAGNGNRQHRQVRFFLATDNSEAREYILNQFDEGVVFSFDRNITDRKLRSDVWGLRLGVIDLFLLASCEALIGTPMSSFSRTATWISGIPRFDALFGHNTTTEARRIAARALAEPAEASGNPVGPVT